MNTASLIYTSVAKTPLDEEQLNQLAELSARRNELIGITGILLYGSGHFLQVLEGDLGAIRTLYDKIYIDPRHHNCRQLYKKNHTHRRFPKWNMGLLNLDTTDSTSRNDWSFVSTFFANESEDRWKGKDPVITWVREFIEHNGDKQGCDAA